VQQASSSAASTSSAATIHVGAKALGYERNADGSVTVSSFEKAARRSRVVVDTVLVAVGMRPNSKGIGLEAAGVKTNERGFVPVDKQGARTCRTSTPIGDVSGPPMLAHKASKEGEIVAEVIAGHKAAMDWVVDPGAIFTDPEIATAGLTSDEAKAKGYEVSVGKFPFAALGRAMAMNETEGFVKVVADKKTKQLLGVHIVGPEASTT
jgi:dihydrolipoamide dehydrogenase